MVAIVTTAFFDWTLLLFETKFHPRFQVYRAVQSAPKRDMLYGRSLGILAGRKTLFPRCRERAVAAGCRP